MWSYGENLKAAALNEVLREPLKHMFKRAGAVIDYKGSYYSTTSTSWVAVDDTRFKQTLTTGGGDVFFALTGVGISPGVIANSWLGFDLFIDDNFYLSSYLSDPTLVGATYLSSHTTLAKYGQICLLLPIVMLPAGEHTFSLHWKVSAGTGYLETELWSASMSFKEF